MFQPARRLTLTVFIAAITAFAALACSAVASAATDRWVDAQTGSDASGNSCTAQGTPCATISQASNASQSAGNFGTIHVDQGTYAESVNIAQGNVLLADDFVGGDGGATAIAAPSSAAVFAQANSTVSGFEISSPTLSTVTLVSDNATLIDNTIIASGANSTAVDLRKGSTGTPTVEGNTLVADSGDEDYGIDVQGNAENATILDNEIGQAGDGFAFGVRVRPGGSGTIEGNTILGARQDGGIPGKGIRLDGAAEVTVTGNLITSPTLAANNESYGVEVDSVGASGRVAFDHNRIIAMSGIGMSLIDSAGEITTDGDLIAANSDRAMYIANANPEITNATIVGNDPIQVGGAAVTIDSSILDVPITTSGGPVSCQITHSRGPAITAGGTGCAEFQTTADPVFVAPNTFDYHLQPSSPLIDAGNPAAPAAGAVDIDGDPRALEGDGTCPIDVERDMGIDEVVVSQPDCTPAPEPKPEEGPADTSAPQTTIDGESKQFGRRARFQLAASESGSTFECRLDRGQFVPCDSEFRSRKLNVGRHTLFARATDAAGNTDSTPTAMKFKLKTKRG